VEDLDDLWPPYSAVAPRRGAPRSQQGQRDSALSRTEIVTAAVALADAEGAEAINMRRIAKELGAGTMSLYWHVASKEQLLNLMVDAVEAEEATVDPSGDWRNDLAQIARRERASLLRHRWKLDFMAGRPPGPNGLLNIERSLASLDGLAIETRTAIQILTTVMTYVTGSVLNEMRDSHVEQEQAGAGLSEGEIEAAMRSWWISLERSGRFSRLLRVFHEGIDPDAAETRDERFEFGLACVLDGIAARIPS
jgi:AcrR family transcriptional regulator